jgi:Rrf2 family transcriptional regulator, cysteine metabolism repressor
MFITTKGRYALRVLVYLADRYGIETATLKKIAKDEEISVKYLEHIMSMLVQQNFVKSTKGSKGGYSLTQPPSHYSVGKILRALENDLYLVPCLDEKLNPCKRADKCTTIEVWKLIQGTIDELIDNLTLLDLLQMQQEKLHKPSLYLTYLMHQEEG